MSDATELLAQLRDIRVPAPTPEPALWPLVLTLTLLLIVLFWLGKVLWRRNNTWAFEVKSGISELQSQPPAVAVQGYAALLKRTVLTLEPEPPVRTMHGDPWLHHLDRFFNTDYFYTGNGRVFGEDLYRPVTLDHTNSKLLGTKLKQLVTRRSFRVSERILSFRRKPR